MIIKNAIKEAIVIEGALYEKMGEDEMMVLYDCCVEVTLKNGDTYIHPHIFRGWEEYEIEPGFTMPGPNRNCKAQAQEFADKVKAADRIDTKHWLKGDNVNDREDPYARLEREWSDNSDHFTD